MDHCRPELVVDPSSLMDETTAEEPVASSSASCSSGGKRAYELD